MNALHKDNAVWLKEMERVIIDYEAFKGTIDFLQKGKDGYRTKLNSLVEFRNWLAIDFPWRLRDDVEELDEDNIPPFMASFLLLYGDMLKTFKEELEAIKVQKLTV